MTAAHPTPPDSDTPPSYPFDEWLDGRIWRLTRGRDFWGPPQHFARRIQSSANARRLRMVLLDFDDDGRFIEIQATPRA